MNDGGHSKLDVSCGHDSEDFLLNATINSHLRCDFLVQHRSSISIGRFTEIFGQPIKSLQASGRHAFSTLIHAQNVGGMGATSAASLMTRTNYNDGLTLGWVPTDLPKIP